MNTEIAAPIEVAGETVTAEPTQGPSATAPSMLSAAGANPGDELTPHDRLLEAYQAFALSGR